MTKRNTLQLKIFSGYLLLMLLVLGIVAGVWHEKRVFRQAEIEELAMLEQRKLSNSAFKDLLSLLLDNEHAMFRDEKDLLPYKAKQKRLFLRLDELRRAYPDSMQRSRIDTVRHLLGQKYIQVRQLTSIVSPLTHADSLLTDRLSVLLSSAAASPQTEKRGGLLAWFPHKEKRTAPAAYTRDVKRLGRELHGVLNMQVTRIARLADSLDTRNKQLNRNIIRLVNDFEADAMRRTSQRQELVYELREQAFRLICAISGTGLVCVMSLCLFIYRDVRQRYRYQDRLERSDRYNRELLDMRKKIILTISHDIRAPLSVINGSAELAMDTRDKKRRNGHLSNIITLCHHVLHLLNNLLDVYRLNESKETRNDVPFHLDDLLERVCMGFSHIINNKGILFQHDFKDTDVTLSGDIDRIEQIIDNLLTNAVKFTESGTIRLVAVYAEGHLLLEIEDTGIGMSEETLSRIFKPFERAASAANAGGFGLGLPITKGLVNLLGGTIEVKSRIGHGSTFRVSLPLLPTTQIAEREHPSPDRPERLPQRVLAIDDDPLQLEIVKEMLERNGVACTTCGNVSEVVHAMRKEDYDLLLTDIQMSGTNGFEVLDLLRNSHIGNSHTIPVVAMTARGDNEKETFINAGFADCLYKPFSVSGLLSLISAAGSHHKNTKEARVPDFIGFTADVRDKPKLLRAFISQSRKDMKELHSAMEAGDRAELREIVHRMQPAWELLQSDDLLLDYRTALKDGTSGKNTIEEYTKRIIEHAAMLVTEAENEIRREMYGTQNIDS